MRGIHQDHIQTILQQVERPPPVIPRRLQHHQRHLLGHQPLPQLQQRIRGRGERPDLLATRALPTRARGAHTRLQVLLADIQPAHRSCNNSTNTLPQTNEPTNPDTRPSGGTTRPKESGPRAHGNNRQLLSVAPNTILTHELTGITVMISVPDRHGPHFPASTAAQRSGPRFLTRKPGRGCGVPKLVTSVMTCGFGDHTRSWHDHRSCCSDCCI